MGKITKINLWGLDFCITFAALKNHHLWLRDCLKEKYMRSF